MNEEKKVKKEDKTEARLAYLERKAVQFERVKNWLETIHGADIDGDSHIGAPKEGSVMTKLLVCISAFCILCGSLFAGVIDDKSAGTGTYTLSQSSIGTGDITLTVDAVAAEKITSDTISQGSGSDDGLTVRSVARASIAITDLVVGTNSLGVVIPDNAVVWDGYIDVTTALQSTGVTATVALELNGSADVLAAVTYTNATGFASTGLKAIIPVGTAATGIKMTGARTLNLVVAEHAGFTQGVATVVLEYDALSN